MIYDRNRARRLSQARNIINTHRDHDRIIYARHTNPELNPLVSKIQVSKQNSTYHVRAFFPDENAYIRGTIFLGQLRYFEFEGQLYGESAFSIKLETNNTQLLLFFIKELIRVSPGLSSSGLIQTLTNNQLSLTNAYQTEQEIPTWDICRTVNIDRRRFYEFQNSSVQAKIRKITVLLGNEGPAFNVRVKCSSDENFHLLVSVLTAENIIEERYHRDPSSHIFCHINQTQPETIRKLRLFVERLKQFEPLLDNPNFARLCDAINEGSVTGERLIPVGAHELYQVRGESLQNIIHTQSNTVTWIKRGEWNTPITQLAGIMRHVNFENPRLVSPVKSVYLSEYRTGELSITLEIRPDAFDTFKSRLIAQDLPEHVVFIRQQNQIILRTHCENSPFLSSFLSKACQAETDIRSIEGTILTMINTSIHNREIAVRDSDDAMDIDTPTASTHASPVMNRINNILAENRQGIIESHTSSLSVAEVIPSIQNSASSSSLLVNPWHRDGNLITFLAVHRENRFQAVVYENLAGGRILKIKLTRWPDSLDITIGIKTNPGRRLELEAAINLNGLRLNFERNILDSWTYIKVIPAHYYDLVELLARLSTTDPYVGHILPEISQGILTAARNRYDAMEIDALIASNPPSATMIAPRQTNSISITSTQPPTNNTLMNPWSREGDLSTFQPVGQLGTGYRAVVYRNTGTSLIQEIRISQSGICSNITIGIMPNHGKLNELINAINLNGLHLSWNVYYGWIDIVVDTDFTVAHTDFTRDFIELLTRLSGSVPDVDLILPEISQGIQSLTPPNPTNAANPPWIREGDFSIDLPNSSSALFYNRTAIYRNNAESPLIRRVFIKQSRENIRKIEIAITSGSNRFQELMLAVNDILEGGHQLTVTIYSDFNEVRVNATPAYFEHLIDFMLNLSMHFRAPELARIHGEIAQGIRIAGQTTPGYTPNPPRADTALQQAEAQSFAEHYGHTAATYRPSQSSGPAMPDIGANAKALEGMDVDVPEHLCCVLSLQVMTVPVRFEGLANQDCFEDAWIMEYLRKNKTHPITRETVSEKMLVSDLPLKRACDLFTEEQVKNRAVNNTRITQ